MAVLQDDRGVEEVFPAEDEPFGSPKICAFDGYFILKWLVNNDIMPKLIMNGNKIIQLDVNRPDDWNLTEPKEYPSLADFDYNSVPDGEKPAFLEWYHKDRGEKSNQYDVQKKMYTYCRMDVTVLRLCYQQFQDLYMTITNGLCPFVSAATIAGVCSVFWRTNFLQKDQIAILSSQGQSRSQSVVDVQWLEWTALNSTSISTIEVTAMRSRLASSWWMATAKRRARCSTSTAVV
ncbi:hypothetical protein RvY_03449 [Ramazzottius varieornatus]|uniref:DNA-directed DNA polymerase n=1 Tax=Ramazzottius varieornatus TaxID=947166 RepID=A0A1D1UN54_RAMVA|nr:hypothetical protein RvY_03449 [Ramazzottius varieornatus]